MGWDKAVVRILNIDVAKSGGEYFYYLNRLAANFNWSLMFREGLLKVPSDMQYSQMATVDLIGVTREV